MKILIGLIVIIATVNSLPLMCKVCIESAELLQKTLIKLTPEFVAKDVVQSVCERQYQSKQLCTMVSKELTPLAIKTGIRGLLKTGKLCSVFCPKSFYSKLNLAQEIQKLQNKNSLNLLSDIKELSYESTNLTIKGKGNLKMLHFTDIHLDLNYTENSSIVCNYPICCHKEDGFPQAQSSKALPFGVPKCDTPPKLFDSVIEYLEKQVKDIDFIIVTGDFSAHNEWQKTKQSVLHVRQMIEDKIQKSLDVKVISSPGNNEYLPDHQVDPMSVMQQSIKVVVVRSDEGNQIAVISINTLFCDLMNLYLIEDQTMSIRQLKTLDTILSKYSQAYLIGHISPTSLSCSESYSIMFRAIIQKHSLKIKGQFYGHTHLDEFVINTNPVDNQTATSFGLLAGSLSPLSTNLPRFRIYELTNTYDLYNYIDYKFDNHLHQWKINYDFKQYYGLEFEKIIDSKLMKEFQNNIKNDQSWNKKYASKVSASSAGDKFYCHSYDSRTKFTQCNQNQLSFKSKILDVLVLLQGPWGAYGDQVQ